VVGLGVFLGGESQEIVGKGRSSGRGRTNFEVTEGEEGRLCGKGKVVSKVN